MDERLARLAPCPRTSRSTGWRRRDLLRLAGGLAAAPVVAVVGPGVAPVPALAQEATPDQDRAGGGLPAMFGLTPDLFTTALSSPAPLATFADIAGQLAVLGLQPPASGEGVAADHWAKAQYGFVRPANLDLAGVPEWRAAFGWTIYEVDQAYEYLDGEERVWIVRGRFDPTAIAQTLTANAYQIIPADAATIFSLSPEPDLLVDNPASLLMVGALNNLALREDGTLVGAGSLATLERALAVAAGAAPSLADRAEVADLLAAIETPLVTALLVPGLTFGRGDFVMPTELGPGTPLPAEIATVVTASEAERQRLPPITLAVLGMTAGGPLGDPTLTSATPPASTVAAPEARVRGYVLFGSPAEAELAVPVIEERLTFGLSFRRHQPWSEIFPGWSVRAVPDRPLVVLDLGGGAARDAWRALLFEGDLWFLSW